MAEAENKPELSFETLVSLCKRRGFVFPGSEIYGGIGGFWDYGPLGVEMKNNIKRAWWKTMVQERDDLVGIDAAIIMNPRVWEASGHVATFTDPMVDCRSCKHRFRADHVIVYLVNPDNVGFVAALTAESGPDEGSKALEAAAAWSKKAKIRVDELRRIGTLQEYIAQQHEPQGFSSVFCPNPDCWEPGSLTAPRQFNLMFKTFVGPVDDEANLVYLRPETAQAMFVHFDNVVTSMRRKLPFGIAQIGRSFRNEITPGNFIFRDREFEQMEIEYFCKPGTDEEWHQHWLDTCLQWYKGLGIRPENLRVREHAKEELAHYAKATYDIEYLFPMGWSELQGIANRTDFDLRQHMQFSGKSLTYFDEESKEHILPYVIEPSAGVDRTFLVLMYDAYQEEQVKDEKRVVLKLHPSIAPIKVAILPLSRNERLTPLAREVHALLRKRFMTQFDDAQSIGRRYRRQDEIGTPFCVTVDFDSLEDNAVTVRDRDSMEQTRVRVEELVEVLREKLGAE